MTPRATFGVVLGVASVACVAGLSRAYAGDEAPGASAAPARRAVDATVAGPDGQSAALESSLREIVGRVGLTLRAKRVALAGGEPAGSAPDALATVSIDLAAPGEVRVTVVDGRTGRVAVRRVLSRAPGSSVTLEEVALVVRSAIDGIVESDRRPPVEKPAPTSPPVPPPPPPEVVDAGAPAVAVESPRETARDEATLTARRSAGWGLDVSAFARVASFAHDEGALVGAGAAATMVIGRGPLRPGLWLLGAYHAPLDATHDAVAARASVLVLRAVPTLAIASSHGWVLEAGAGGGADLLALGLTPLDARAQPAPPGEQVIPVATALVALQAPIASNLALTVMLTGDADLSPHRYVVAEAGGNAALLAPLPVRVGATVGFTFNVAGAERER